jgi:hypothetical protein
VAFVLPLWLALRDHAIALELFPECFMHSKRYAVCVPTIPAFCRCCIVLCCSQTAPQCAWLLQPAAGGG